MSYLTEYKQPIVLLLTHTPLSGGNHGHITATFLRKEEENYYNGCNATVNGLFINDLQVDAWYSREYPELNYGFASDTVTYHAPWCVDLAIAKAITATLTKIEKGLYKVEDANGRADSFGEYLLRVAKVLGVTEFIFTKRPGSFHSSTDYTQLTPTQLREWVKTVTSESQQIQASA